MSTPATAEQPVFETDQGRFSLQRYPRQKNSQLKAWDAADAYLLNTLSEQNLADKKLLIVHDNFGALSLPLLPFSPMVYGDSWMSEQAVRQNLIANGIEAEIDFESSLETLLARDTKPECIVGRVPKNKAQFAYLLSRLREFAAPGCELFLAGMDKHLSRGQYELVEEYFGPSSFMPGVKKARIWRAKVDKTLSTRASYFKRFSLPEFALNIDSAPNVFSRDKLDIGTRFLLEQIAKLPQKARVVDLACGNGVLGLAYLKRYAPESLLFVDESYQAIESVRYNLENNWGQSLDSDPNYYPNYSDSDPNYPDPIQIETKVSDGLKQLAAGSCELILCNPPFHQENIVNKDIAASLFRDAKNALSQKGEMWLVVNRHLAYDQQLKHLFGNCSVMAKNAKFVVLKVVKR